MLHSSGDVELEIAPEEGWCLITGWASHAQPSCRWHKITWWAESSVIRKIGARRLCSRA